MNWRLLRWTGQPPVHIVGLFVSVVAAVAIVAFAIGTLEYTKTRGKLLLTALLVGGYFVTMLAATGIPAVAIRQQLRAATQCLATGAMFLLLLGLWGAPDSDAYWKAASIATLLAMGMVCSGLATRAGLGDAAVRALALTSAAAAGLLTVMAALGIALEIRLPLYWWVFGLLVVSWLAASAAIPATAFLRLRRRKKPP